MTSPSMTGIGDDARSEALTPGCGSPFTPPPAWNEQDPASRIPVLIETKDSIRVAGQFSPETEREAMFLIGFDDMQRQGFENSIRCGFHPDLTTPPNNDQKNTSLVMITGEVSEVVDALRKGNPESTKIPGFTCEEEEMADIVLRSMDYAGRNNLRLSAAIVAKKNYNSTRPYLHGGKKF